MLLKQATFLVVFLAHSSRGITFYSLGSVSDNCSTKKLMTFFELFLPNPYNTHTFLPKFQNDVLLMSKKQSILYLTSQAF